MLFIDWYLAKIRRDIYNYRHLWERSDALQASRERPVYELWMMYIRILTLWTKLQKSDISAQKNRFFHDNFHEIAYMMRKVVRVFQISVTFIIMAMKAFMYGQYAMMLFQQNQLRRFFTITPPLLLLLLSIVSTPCLFITIFVHNPLFCIISRGKKV